MINNLFGQIKTSDLQEFSAEVTIVISTSPKMIKAEQLFAPSTAHEFRLSAEIAVVRTSPIGEAVLYEGSCVMSEHSSTTAKQAGHPNIFGMDDNPAHFPHRPRSGMPHD